MPGEPRLTAIPPRMMPRLLTLPDAVLSRLARRVVAIDPRKRDYTGGELCAARGIGTAAT